MLFSLIIFFTHVYRICQIRLSRITPVLQELHWLPVRRRVDFKMATLVYLSLSGMAPASLAADCQLVSDEGRRQLRCTTSMGARRHGQGGAHAPPGKFQKMYSKIC